MNRFFINYCIGGRGDFLATCLLDSKTDWDLLKDFKEHAKMPPPINSVKIHGDINKEVITRIEGFPTQFKTWGDLFQTVNSNKLVKLKIITDTIEERADLTWLACSKVILNNNCINKLTATEVVVPTVQIIQENLFYLVNQAIDKIIILETLDIEFNN